MADRLIRVVEGRSVVVEGVDLIKQLLAGAEARVQTAIDDAVAGLPEDFKGDKGDKGDPGGNVMAIGLFTDIPSLTIGAGVKRIYTTGHSVERIGPAAYAYDADVDAAYVTANPLTAAISDDGYGFRLAEDVLEPSYFGALGGDDDGNADTDHAALRALSAYCNARGRADIRLSQQLVAGKQIAGTGTRYLAAENPLHLIGCNPVNIHWAGGKLRFRDGMKFGSFDPATGNALNPTLPFYDTSKRADIGVMVYMEDCGQVNETGAAEIDCNAGGMIVGVGWGDTGTQCSHAGKFDAGLMSHTSTASLYIHDSLLDCYIVSQPGLTETDEPRLAYIRNMQCYRAARNVVSIVGSNAMDIDDCVFAYPGQGIYGSSRLESSPKSSFDIEAESSVNRNLHLGPNVHLIMGEFGSTALVADSGDSEGLHIEARMYGRAWTSRPKTVFENFTLNGVFAKVAGGFSDPDDCTRILRGVVSDVPVYDEPQQGTNSLLFDANGAGAGVLIEGNQFYLTRTGWRSDGWISRNNRWHVQTGTTTRANQEFIGIVGGTSTDDEIIDLITVNAPADGYYIAINSGTVIRRSKVLSPGGGYKIRWWSWSAPGAGGFPYSSFTDGVMNYGAERLPSIMLHRGLGAGNANLSGQRLIASAAAMPTSGTYARDDLVLAESQTVSSGKIVFGWLRLTTGSGHTLNTDWFPLTIANS